jgi:hypothetical protein
MQIEQAAIVPPSRGRGDSPGKIKQERGNSYETRYRCERGSGYVRQTCCEEDFYGTSITEGTAEDLEQLMAE